MRIKRFSPKQRRVMTWWSPGNPDSRHDAIICDGAVRSGKTLCMGLSFVCWAMSQFRGAQFAFCGKSVVSLRRNLLNELTPLLGELGFACREKRSENLLVIRRGDRENRFYLMGGKDEGSAAFIQGVTLAGVLLDEAALMPRSFVEQAIARCSVSGSRLWFNCNPEGPQHWFYQEWILKAEERNALYLHFTMEDNPSLSPRIIRRYRSSYSGAFYRRFILGEWTAAKGLVYDFFDPGRDAADRPEGEMEEYAVSVDYGTANPCSFGLWGLREGVWYRMEEYYYASRRTGVQLTDQEYVAAMDRLTAGRVIGQVVVDPSAASFITALRQAGVPGGQGQQRRALGHPDHRQPVEERAAADLPGVRGLPAGDGPVPLGREQRRTGQPPKGGRPRHGRHAVLRRHGGRPAGERRRVLRGQCGAAGERAAAAGGQWKKVFSFSLSGGSAPTPLFSWGLWPHTLSFSWAPPPDPGLLFSREKSNQKHA